MIAEGSARGGEAAEALRRDARSPGDESEQGVDSAELAVPTGAQAGRSKYASADARVVLDL